jgi:pimeloyl-ACP methyl ester carboxylesterase
MKIAVKAVVAVGLMATFLPLAIPPALAQSRDAFIERFRAQCREQFQHLRGPGQRTNFRSHVYDCAAAKMRALSLAQARTFRLFDFTPWLVNNKGPENAKGVIYFILGWAGSRPTLDEHRLVPYFLKTLSENGWDIVGTKVPQHLPNQDIAVLGSYEAAPSIVRQQIQKLKVDGYRRVILAGHSWGGWIVLLAAQANDLAADALLLSAPSVGPKTFDGRNNPKFEKNFTEYPRLMNGIKTPTVLMLYDKDDEDPGGRGEVAKKHFEQNKVPHLLIDKPAGFTGHFAGWLPLFDYEFGRCIQSFLDNPKTDVCNLSPLANDDFRSILNLNQIADADGKRITTADMLVGKKFAAYTLGVPFRDWEFVSTTKRHGTRAPLEFDEDFAFRDGKLCINDDCYVLVRWSDGYILSYHANSGDLSGWWIEH